MRKGGSMSRAALGMVLLFSGCSGDVADRFVDGGGFRLPDAGVRDASVPGPGDSGPFRCEPACSGESVCACLDTRPPDCGCHPPGTFGDACDPGARGSCADPLACVTVRVTGTARAECSDGREGSPCSHAEDVCTTALGCVCLTDPAGTTDCRCTERVDPSARLCDRMVPASCPGGTCVRAEGPSGAVYGLCSDGRDGRPCEPGDGSCRTSLGCTCPLVAGRERCRCSEPAGAGEACDLRVAGACAPPLECRAFLDPRNGSSTLCGGEPAGPPAGCDPADPSSCPEGYVCSRTAQGYQCIPWM